MNAQLFKKLIKDACREAVREELNKAIKEGKFNNNNILQEDMQSFNFTTENIDPSMSKKMVKQQMDQMFGGKTMQKSPSQGLKVLPGASNPFAAFLEDSAQNLTPQELNGLRNSGGGE